MMVIGIISYFYFSESEGFQYASGNEEWGITQEEPKDRTSVIADEHYNLSVGQLLSMNSENYGHQYFNTSDKGGTAMDAMRLRTLDMGEKLRINTQHRVNNPYIN